MLLVMCDGGDRMDISNAPDQPATKAHIRGQIPMDAQFLLTPEALQFLVELHRYFQDRIEALLAARRQRQQRLDAGERLAFLPETKHIRDSAWQVAPLPPDLIDRRVEITGPVDRKTIINALNSGANGYMADFEDATSPVWENIILGQKNLFDAVRGKIGFVDDKTGKSYQPQEKHATLMVRPRGLHLPESHLLVDDKDASGALFDFGCYFFHNVKALIEQGTAPYFYLPKLESHLEARLWNDVFFFAEQSLGVSAGTIRATVLIETLPAAFEMDEILFELRSYAAGLNCGRWDYIFSFIKSHRANPGLLLPNRSQITMEQPCMQAYAALAIQTCHRRGALAMGGMAAQIPIRGDDQANEHALSLVRRDKEREARAGHDGTWVAHPALVPIARQAFDDVLGERPNQVEVTKERAGITADELLRPPLGSITDAGVRLNVRVGIQYLAAWLEGVGCVPLYHLMEDAATAEISRAQLWQWLHHHARLADQTVVDDAYVQQVFEEELTRIRDEVGEPRFTEGRFQEARTRFQEWVYVDELPDFLTSEAYPLLIHTE